MKNSTSFSEYLKNNNDTINSKLNHYFCGVGCSETMVNPIEIEFKKFKHKDLDGYEKYRNATVLCDNNKKYPLTMIIIKK